MKTLYTNGTVFTMSPKCPEAEALVEEEGTIIGVGDRKEMADLAGEGTSVVDMEGGFLLPGFIESHNHLSMCALFSEYAYVGGCKTVDEVVTAIKDFYAKKKVSLCIAYGYDDTNTEGGQINRHHLNRVSEDIPVFVAHISMHIGYLNDAALVRHGITAESIPQKGGAIHFDNDGFPTGRLDEIEWFRVFSNTAPFPDKKKYKKLFIQAVSEFNRQGCTMVHDAGLGIERTPGTILSVCKELDEEDELNIRCFFSALSPVFDELNPEPLTGFQCKFGVGGVKLFTDGSIQGDTAALLKPYHHRPEWKGELITDPDKFIEEFVKYHKEGHHISVHANGDAGIELVIQALEKAQSLFPQKSRHMLVHAQMAHEQHLKKMRRLGMIPTFFAYHVHHFGDRHRNRFLGEDRASRIDPAGTAQKLGLPFAFHIDSPVFPVTVLSSIQAAVTRKTSSGAFLGKAEAVSPYTAIAAYTTMAALCSRSEEYRGRLEVGKDADLVLLDRDITACAPETISDAIILRTVVAGKTVYQSR